MRRFPEKIRVEAPEQLLKCISGIESFLKHMTVVRTQNPTSFNSLKLQAVSPDEYISATLKILYAIYAAKFVELVDGLIEATDRENFLVFAYCGRGIVETTAVLRYYNKKTLAVATSAPNPDAFSAEELAQLVGLLDRHSRGGRFDWTQYWASGRKTMAHELVAAQRKKQSSTTGSATNPSQINVVTAIDAWIADESGIALIYYFFCELVHPNLGSNFLVMGTREDALCISDDMRKTIGRSLALEGIELLAPILRDATSGMVNLLLWKETWGKTVAERGHDRVAGDGK